MFGLMLLAFARGVDGREIQADTVHFQRLSIEQGLSQSVVTDILQDHRGFLWFGTQDGLNRFDGSRFRVYRHLPGDPASLSCNYVRGLLEDGAGGLWVGTRGGGLNRYDRRTGRFTVYRHDPRNSHGPSSDVIMSLSSDKAGRIWVCTDAGLDLFDPRNGSWEHFRHDPARPRSLSSSSTTQALTDRHGVLWVATYGGGLNRFHPAQKDFTVYRANPALPGCLSNDQVLCLLEDRQGVLWVGTDEGGLNRYDAAAGTFTVFRAKEGDAGSLPGETVLSLCEDREGNFWVGTDQGLCLFDRKTGRGRSFRHDARRPESLSNNYVLRMVQDRSGILWLGTWSGGLSKYDGLGKKFRTWRNDPYNPESLADDGVNAVIRDRSGCLWVGLDVGLNFCDPVTGKWVLYRKEFTRPGRALCDRVVSLLEDRDGILWVGTWGSGLFRRDPSTGRFHPVARGASGITTPYIFSLIEGRDGSFWIGLFGGGLVHFDKKSEHCRCYRHDPADPASLSSDQVISLFEDRTGAIWVGTMVGGLNRLDPLTGKFTHWRQSPNNTQALGSDTIWCIREDRAGMLWIGTGGGGLARFEPRSGRIRVWRTTDGLPNDVVYAILEASNGEFWLSTNKGLCRFDPVRLTFRTYDAADGLPGNELNQSAYFKAGDGEMLFGGIGGLVSFYPEEIEDNPVIPPVVITGVLKFNREVDLGGEVAEMNEITLSPGDSVFTIEYAALNFIHPEKTNYTYRMVGFDKDWIPAGNARSATYTNLDPGVYLFRVRGSNNDGKWNQVGASLRVVVLPPFWRTWWFRLLAALVAICLVAGAYLLRIKTMKQREKELARDVTQRTEELAAKSEELQAANRELEAEIRERQHFEEELGRVNEMLRLSNEKLQGLDSLKTDFLNMAAHEIRTPLTSVLGFAKIAYKKFAGLSKHLGEKENEKVGKSIEIVRENLSIIIQEADRLTALINELLDVAKLEAGKVEWDFRWLDAEALLERAMASTASLARLKGLDFVREVEPGLPPVYGDRDRLLQVLINLISNAVKFTEKGGVTGSVTSTAEGICFCVRDTGIGIAREHLPKVFEKFGQVGDTLTKRTDGTGLGLTICRQIIERHGGRIDVGSEPGHGSTFFFTLPLKSPEKAGKEAAAPLA